MIFQLYIVLAILLKQFDVIVEALDDEGNIAIGTFFEETDFPKAALLYAKSKYSPINVTTTDYARLEPDNPFSACRGVCSMLKSADFLFGLQSSSNFDIVQRISNWKKIPLVLTRWVNNQKLIPETTISFYPDPEILNQAFFDIISNLKWNSFTLLYTDSEHLIRVSGFLDLSREAGIVVDIANPVPRQEFKYNHVLKKLKKQDQKNFVLNCPAKLIKKVLKQLQHAGMLTTGYRYFILDMNVMEQDIEQFIDTEAEFTVVQLKIKDDVNKLYEISQEICATYKNISYEGCTSKYGAHIRELNAETFLTIDAVRVLIKYYGIYADKLESVSSQLDCDSDSYNQNGPLLVKQIMINSHYSGLTGYISFGSNGYRNNFELEVNQFREYPLSRATWNTRVGYTPDKNNDDKSDNSTNFAVGIKLVKPYAFLIESKVNLKGNDRYAGFVVDLIKEMSLIAGFNYTFIAPVDHSYGSYDFSSKQWTGMIGDLLNHKIDLIVGDMTITHGRSSVVDFTLPFFTTGLRILFQKPLVTPPHFFHFAQPFSTEVWMAIGIAYLISVVSLFIVGRLSLNNWHKFKTNGKTYLENPLTMSNTIWFITGSLLKQNTQVKIRSVPARIIVASWWLICFITVAMYVGVSVSFVTKSETKVLFSDVEELVEKYVSHGIEFGAVRGGATHKFFRDSSNPTYQEIGAHMNDNPDQMVENVEAGVSRAEVTNYAFFTEASTIEYIVKRHCSLTQYGPLLDYRSFGIAIRPGSPYLAALDKAILKLLSNGKLAELKTKWWDEKLGAGQCDYEDDFEEVDVHHLVHLTGLFTISFFGVVVAFILAFFNLFLHVWKKSKERGTGFTTTLSEEIQIRFGCAIKKLVEQNEGEQEQQQEQQQQQDNDDHGEIIELS